MVNVGRSLTHLTWENPRTPPDFHTICERPHPVMLPASMASNRAKDQQINLGVVGSYLP